MVRDYVGDVWESDLWLSHIEDDLHIDCAYCYAVEYGTMPEMPASVCSVHMAWLERKAWSLVVEPKKERVCK